MEGIKMNKLGICVLCLSLMFDSINDYHFSFMDLKTFLVLVIWFVGLFFFYKSWFYYGWGVFTGIVILVPMIIELFHRSQNYAAFVFDGVLSLGMLGYSGYYIYKKIMKNKHQI